MITIKYGSVQNQVAWSPQQPGLERSVAVHGRFWNKLVLRVLFNPNQSTIWCLVYNSNSILIYFKIYQNVLAIGAYFKVKVVLSLKKNVANENGQTRPSTVKILKDRTIPSPYDIQGAFYLACNQVSKKDNHLSFVCKRSQGCVSQWKKCRIKYKINL